MSKSGKVPRDRRFGVYPTIAVTVAALPLVGLIWQLNLILGMAMMLLITLTVASGPFVIGSALARRRPRSALAALLGMILILSDIKTMPVAHRALDDFAFRSRQPDFEEMVALARARDNGYKPVRLVVQEEDRSIFVTSNLFVLTIYDESDLAERDPLSVAEDWPCPSSSTGVLDVGGLSGGSRAVDHIQGHYYRVTDWD